MVIRAASYADQQAWFLMRNSLWPDSHEEHHREIERYLQGDRQWVDQVMVAQTDNGQVLGFIEIKIRNYAEGSLQPAVPYVEGWYVEPEWRGQGVGKALIQRVEQWAIEQGYKELASDTELENTGSQAAHQALGFQEVERAVHFIKSLE